MHHALKRLLKDKEHTAGNDKDSEDVFSPALNQWIPTKNRRSCYFKINWMDRCDFLRDLQCNLLFGVHSRHRVPALPRETFREENVIERQNEGIRMCPSISWHHQPCFSMQRLLMIWNVSIYIYAFGFMLYICAYYGTCPLCNAQPSPTAAVVRPQICQKIVLCVPVQCACTVCT